MQDLPYFRIRLADLNRKFELAQKSDQIGPKSDQIGSSNQLMNRLQLKKLGINNCNIEGKDSNDWKLVDTQDVIIHIFHPEKREFYDLEKMWSEEIPKEKAMI